MDWHFAIDCGCNQLKTVFTIYFLSRHCYYTMTFFYKACIAENQ